MIKYNLVIKHFIAHVKAKLRKYLQDSFKICAFK